MTTWRTEAAKVERELHDFLGLNSENSVIYLNRAAAGIRIALIILARSARVLRYEWPSFEAVRNLGCEETSLTLSSFHRGDGYPERKSNTVMSPVALGGEPIDISYFGHNRLLYDCAQSCYRDMFDSVHFTDDKFAVLSFEKSKPLGVRGGGGALICNSRLVKVIKERFVPGFFYFNPRASQCTDVFAQLINRYALDEESLMRRNTFRKDRRLLLDHDVHIHNSNLNNGNHSFHPTHIYIRAPFEGRLPSYYQKDFHYYADNALLRMQL